MSEYLSGVTILMLVLSPLFIPIAVTIIDAVRRWASLAAHSSRTHRSRSSDDLPPKPAATAGTGLHALVGGVTAAGIDAAHQYSARLPLVIGAASWWAIADGRRRGRGLAIAACVIGGISILGGRGHYLGTVAGSITLVALVSVLLAENMPDWGRSVVYGVSILFILLLYGRERRQL